MSWRGTALIIKCGLGLLLLFLCFALRGFFLFFFSGYSYYPCLSKINIVDFKLDLDLTNNELHIFWKIQYIANAIAFLNFHEQSENLKILCLFALICNISYSWVASTKEVW